MRGIRNLTERTLFGSKWILTIFYFGLIVAMMAYAYVYILQILHLFEHVNTLNKEMVLICTLELVDMVMIANLIKMIITGSYTSSVNKNHEYANEKVSSGILKIKLSTSLIGVTSIHLLQTFVNSENVSWDSIYKQMAIHGVFILGSIGLAIVEYFHDKGDALNPHDNDGIMKEHKKR
jgi:uncharacterized protein (TIGR00645 family)